jgi:O-antigen ligase
MAASGLALGPGRAHAGPSPALAGGLALGAAGLAAAASVLLGPIALGLPFLGAAAWLLLRRPLLLFVLFLHIGLFKNQPVVEAIPADATLLLGVLLAGVCVNRAIAGRVASIPVLFAAPLLLIGIMLAVSLTWTSVFDYGLDKTLKFVTLTYLAAVAPFCLVENRDDLVRFLALFAGTAFVTALMVMAFGSAGADDRLEFGGAANTIFTSRFILTGALILLVAPMLRLVTRHRLVLPVVAIGMIGVAASIGSRGPVVALVFALVCTIVAAVLREPERLIPVLVVIAVGTAVLPFVALPGGSSERLRGLAENPAGTLNEDLRSRLYDKAVELSGEYPLRGIGAGGFFLYSYVLTNREERYPHNVFLETSAELGIFPALLLGVSILVLLGRLYTRAWTSRDGRDRNLVYLVSGVFLLNLFAAQFSGDYNDNRTFWAAFGLAWLVAAHGLRRSAVESG